ncbi:hypothetical protein HK102_011410, partial [Quaeritorhiza haematococci]
EDVANEDGEEQEDGEQEVGVGSNEEQEVGVGSNEEQEAGVGPNEEQEVAVGPKEEQEVGDEEQEVAVGPNEEQEVGNEEQEVGNEEQEVGNEEQEVRPNEEQEVVVGLNEEQEVGNEEQEVWSSPASSSLPEQCLKRNRLDNSDGGANGRKKRARKRKQRDDSDGGANGRKKRARNRERPDDSDGGANGRKKRVPKPKHRIPDGEIGVHYVSATEDKVVGDVDALIYVDTSFTSIIERPSKESIERYWKRTEDKLTKGFGGQQYDCPWTNTWGSKALTAAYAFLRVYNKEKRTAAGIATLAEDLGLKKGFSLSTIGTALSRIFKDGTDVSKGRLFAQRKSKDKKGGNIYWLNDEGVGRG